MKKVKDIGKSQLILKDENSEISKDKEIESQESSHPMTNSSLIEKNTKSKKNLSNKSNIKINEEEEKNKSQNKEKNIEKTSEKNSEKKSKKNSLSNNKSLISKSSSSSSYQEEESIDSQNEGISPQEIQFRKAYYLGNIALRLKNYDEAIRFADDLALFSKNALSKEETRVFLGCNFLYMEKLRNGYRTLCDLLLDDKHSKKLIQEIKNEKEKIILKRCEKVIKIINENILSKNLNTEETAMFLKVKADYYRYMAEITTGHLLFINKQNAFHFYNEAKELVKDLDDLNATKLNISLNYSVFLNEILNMRINSFFYAKEALYNALKSLKNCNEEVLTSEEMKDTLMIIETLNNNVEDWYKEEVGDIFNTENKNKQEKAKEKLESHKKKKKEKKDKDENNLNLKEEENDDYKDINEEIMNEQINQIENIENEKQNNTLSGINKSHGSNIKSQIRSQIFSKAS